jgi:hypothetical protein
MSAFRSPRSLRPTHRHAGALTPRATLTRALPFPIVPAALERRGRYRGMYCAAALLTLGFARPYSLAAQATTPPVPIAVPPIPVPPAVPVPVTLPVNVSVLPAAPPVAILAYRAPALALVQPQGGGIVPADRPAVVFRFALGEPDDPLDTRSFTVAVDGHDRTALFQLAATQAWGPLAPANENGGALAAGAHQLTARICSARGACAVVSATVTAVTDAAVAPTTGAPNAMPSKKSRILDLLLSGAKRLIEKQ